VSDVLAELEIHDELLARRNIDVWVGGEPTFTRADSLEPAWLADAEGDDKLERAYRLAVELAAELPGARVTRVQGRQYPDEKAPRFAWGVRWRDGDAEPGVVAPLDGATEPPPTALGGDHFLSVTPDPGVVEVNMAPASTVSAFAAQAERIWRAAASAGLSSVRHRFNGDIADSGGGGQLTFGGSTPATSPFIRYPHVLPALLRYVNNHPSLSYYFASECVGSASQGPRPDEGTRERWDELELGLRHLEGLADRGELPPEHLYLALAPLLVDSAGNAHRAELNIEKLWSPHVSPHGTRHGKMGVVELRAIRMPERPSMLAAVATLFRAIIARLVVADYREPLIDWHDELHDRFALPMALSRDLRHVLGDLDDHRFGIPATLRSELDAWRPPGIACRLGDATLTIRGALEFWPLVGDVASQERAGARIVDASTQRLELAIEGPVERIAIAGKWAQLRSLGDARVLGVRRRVYMPAPGFHPGLPPLDPLVIEWENAGRVQRIELRSWKPDGGPYDGLPADASAALARRNERVAISIVERIEATGHWPQTRPYTIDLRY
jgi:uncharacterized protein (DUF2126 family)